MALARTTLLGQASTEPHGTTNFTTSSFTPPDNSLLVVCVATMRVSTATDLTSSITCAGGSWTYTPRVGRGSSTSVYSVSQRIFTAPVTTGASMTLTLGTGGVNMQFYAVSVVAYTGYDTGTPTGATGSLLVEDSGAPDGAQSFTLSSAPATTSEVVAAITPDKDAVGTTPGSGWTEVHDVQAGGAGGVQSQVRTGSTSTSVAWVDTNTGGSIFKFVAAAVEVRADTGPVSDAYQWAPRQFAGRVPGLFRTGVRAPLQLMGDRTSPVPGVDATVAAATVATVTAFPVPSVSTGSDATVGPAVVATTAGVGSPTVSTGSTITPVVIGTASAVGAATVSAEVLADPNQAGPQVAWMFTAPEWSSVQLLGATHVELSATATPATIVTSASVPGPGVSTGQTATVSAIATVAALAAPSVSTGSTAAPASLATAVALPAPGVSTGSTATPSVVATSSALLAPNISIGSTATPSAVLTVASLPAPSVSTGSNATPTPATIATVAGVGSASVQTGSSVSATSVATSTALPVPSLSTGTTANPATVATVTALPTPSAATGASTSAGTIATVTSVGTAVVQTGSTVVAVTIATVAALSAPSVSTGSNATVGAVVIATASTVPAPSLSVGASVVASAIATVVALPGPSVSTGSNATVGAVVIATVSILPLPALSAGSTVAAQVIATYAAVGSALVIIPGSHFTLHATLRYAVTGSADLRYAVTGSATLR